jgi:hypothetical protein
MINSTKKIRDIMHDIEREHIYRASKNTHTYVLNIVLIVCIMLFGVLAISRVKDIVSQTTLIAMVLVFSAVGIMLFRKILHGFMR